jgi:hypothetical protein
MKKYQEIQDPFLLIGGKTSTTGYTMSIHQESFWWIQLKITDHRTNQKGEHSTKWNFLDWTQNYLPDWHAAVASITQVARMSDQPLEVANHHQNDLFR